MVVHGLEQASNLVRVFTALVFWRPAYLAGFFMRGFCGGPTTLSDKAPTVGETMSSVQTTTNRVVAVGKTVQLWRWWPYGRNGPPGG